MATTPQFASTVTIGSGVISAAMTGSTTTPSNATLVFTAGASGGRVDEVDICGLATTVANVIRLWVNDNSTNWFLIKEIAVPATTASGTAAAYQTTITFNNLMLPASYKLYAGVATAESTGFRITAFGGSF